MEIKKTSYSTRGIRSMRDAHELLKYYARFDMNNALGLTHFSSNMSDYDPITNNLVVGHRCVIVDKYGICAAVLAAPLSEINPDKEYRLTHIELPTHYTMINVIVLKDQPGGFILCTNTNINANSSSFSNGLSKSNLGDQFDYLMNKKNLMTELNTYIATVPDYTVLVFIMTDLLKCNEDGIYFMYEVKDDAQINTEVKFQNIPFCTVYADMSYADALKNCKSKLPSFFSFNPKLSVLRQVPYKLCPSETDNYLKAFGNMPSAFQRILFLCHGLKFDDADKTDAYFKQYDDVIISEQERLAKMGKRTIKRVEGLNHKTAMKHLENLCANNPITVALFFYAFYRLAGRMMLAYDRTLLHEYEVSNNSSDDVEINRQVAKLVDIVKDHCKDVHQFNFYTLFDIHIDHVFLAVHMVKEMRNTIYPPYDRINNGNIDIARARLYLQFVFSYASLEMLRDLFGDSFEILLNEANNVVKMDHPTNIIEHIVMPKLGLCNFEPNRSIQTCLVRDPQLSSRTYYETPLNIESMTEYPSLTNH
jgi:hypothetical protein